MVTTRTNWAGNLSYGAARLHQPETISDLQQLISESYRIRAVGTRHSFNAIADTLYHQVSTEYFNKIISLDKEKNRVTVEAGIKYGELCTWLAKEGYALHNLASLPHISVAGACVTATHGSGIKNGNLATAVAAIEFIDATGNIVILSRDKDGAQFHGAVVNIGTMGILTKMTLDIQPAFFMQQAVYTDLPMQELERNFEDVMSAGYSVSLFTNWRNKNINQVWIKTKTGETMQEALPGFHTARAATKHLHPLPEMPADNCTDQLCIKGEWYERLPHFKMGFTPSGGKELQSEYFISFEKAYEGMMAIERLADKISPHLLITEIRAIAADDLWLSPFYKKTCVAFHFTWKQEWHAVSKVLPLIEEALAPYRPLPHWGKLFTLQPAVLQSRIQRLDDFKELANHYDPAGKFRNEFVDTFVFNKI